MAQMTVKELRAQFQKKSAQSNIVPQPKILPTHNKVHTQHVPQHIITPKPQAQIIKPQQIPVITQQTVVMSGSMRNNAKFIAELEKKLQKKSQRHSHLEQNFQYYSREQVEPKAQTTHKQEEKRNNPHQLQIPTQMIRPKSKTFDVSPEQLDFSSIIGNNNEGVIKSRVRARLAVDQRHPLTKQDKILFTELDSQIRQTVQAQKIERENKQKSEKVNIINVSRQDIAKSIVESTKIEEKISRIDYFLECIFGEKEREFVGQKAMQNIGTNIVDLFNQKIKTFKKHPIHSQVISLTTPSISNTTPSSQTPLIKTQQVRNNPITSKPLETRTDQEKKQFSTVPLQGQYAGPILSMTKQMLQQMNMKLKQKANHQEIINPSEANLPPLADNISNPIHKKKRVLQKFDEV